MTPAVWRPGCPVGLSDLRRVTLTYVGFDGRAHQGALVVNRTVAAPVARAFGELYAARFPIRRMLPIEAYGGSDFGSIEADNTSAFNCRSATGSSHWSEHAYGRAIDLDPIENPYVSGGSTSHTGLAPLRRPRARRRPAGRDHRRRRRHARVRAHRLGLGRPLERHARLPAPLGQRPLSVRALLGRRLPRAIARRSSALSSTDSSTPCARATSRSERPLEVASRTIALARS